MMISFGARNDVVPAGVRGQQRSVDISNGPTQSDEVAGVRKKFKEEECKGCENCKCGKGKESQPIQQTNQSGESKEYIA